jgi:hypothetical protein
MGHGFHSYVTNYQTQRVIYVVAFTARRLVHPSDKNMGKSTGVNQATRND